MRYWLVKAEPDSRVVKGKDVKFSVDDFEAAGTTAWEGVRNFEARNLMKEMTVGDKVLFYHSNCKSPGVAGFAEICKEAYPDYTAWDSTHPYYDPKTDKESPKWFMVDVKFVSRAEHFVSLSLLRYVAGLPSVEPPEEIAYIGLEGVKAIKDMALLNRGRLSVQRVSEECWDVIGQMAQRGGWDDSSFSQNVGKSKSRSKRKPATEKTEQGVEDGAKDSLGEHTGPDGIAEEHAGTSKGKRGRKRKELDGEVVAVVAPRRKSARTK